MPSVVLELSAGPDSVDPPKETVAESAERKSSALEGSAFRRPVLDYHTTMSLEAAGVAEAAEVDLVAELVVQGPRLCQ